MELLEYKGYKGTVDFSQEDNCFFGKVIDISDLVSYEGKNKKELEKDFYEAVDAHIELRDRLESYKAKKVSL